MRLSLFWYSAENVAYPWNRGDFSMGSPSLHKYMFTIFRFTPTPAECVRLLLVTLDTLSYLVANMYSWLAVFTTLAGFDLVLSSTNMYFCAESPRMVLLPPSALEAAVPNKAYWLLAITAALAAMALSSSPLYLVTSPLLNFCQVPSNKATRDK